MIQALLKADRNLARSVSVTTRPPRAGERDGRDYWFVNPAEFDRARKKKLFLECAHLLNHWYATPRERIERTLRSGRDLILGIDIQGARQIRRSGFPATLIFLLPPSLSVLRKRLKGRGTETAAQIAARLRLARRELAEVKRYDYAVVNDRLADAVASVRAILRAERCRVEQMGEIMLKGMA